MDKNNGTVKDQEVQKKLEDLKVEYNSLHTKKIATEQDRKNLENQLKTLKEKAQAEYGTSDIAELRKLLEDRRKDNERKVEEYRDHINGIKEQLKAIETDNAAEE